MTLKYATSADDFLNRADVITHSGLEYLHGVIAGTYPTMTIGQDLNIRITRAEFGLVEVTGSPGHRQTNTFGGVHGGWYGVMLDSCLTCAVISTLKPGQFQTTLEYKVNLVKAIPVGAEVIGTGRIEHTGRSTGIARGDIRGTDGTLYALGTATCFIFSNPA